MANTTISLQLLETGVSSARVTDLLRTVRVQARPYQKEPAVRYDQYTAA